MRKVALVMVLVLIAALAGPPVVQAASRSLEPIASWTDSATGITIQFLEVKSNDVWRGNQVVIYAIETNKVEQAPGQKARIADPKLLSHDTASSTGFWSNFFTQGRRQ
jgi:hypothetical protein